MIRIHLKQDNNFSLTNKKVKDTQMIQMIFIKTLKNIIQKETENINHY